MRLSNLTRQAMYQVLCFVVTVSVLGTVPGMVQAETRAECIARVTQKSNDDMAVCGGKLNFDQILCEDERADAYREAFLEQFNKLLIIEADYTTHREFNESEKVADVEECDATQLMCHQTNYNIYILANFACLLSPTPGICQMLVSVSYVSSELLCDTSHQTCVNDAYQRRDDRDADAKRFKQARKDEAEEIRTGKELAAEIAKGVCIAQSWLDYFACVLRAAIAEQAGRLACPADGHGAHDAPPGGHGAPPPPAGHGAPPPPAGHGAP